MYMYIHVHVHVHIHVTALGVLCCFAFVCLTLLASFFLPSHLSFKNMYHKQALCRHVAYGNITRYHIRTCSFVSLFIFATTEADS